ncbi:MAG: hypothetical protein ACJAU0_000338 [Flavobacteriales bacterium]
MIRSFCNLVCLFYVTFSSIGQISLNEVCSSNSSIVADEAGQFDDWIELFNSGETAINLQGWSIGKESTLDNGYEISSDEPLFIAPNSFILLWCDNELSQGNAHLPFKLNNAGEEIFLFAPNDELIESRIIPFHFSNNSWGINLANEWRNFQTPTPLLENTSTSYLGTLAPPQATFPSGIYDFDLDISLQHEFGDALITYTLNGIQPEDDDESFLSPIELTENTIVTSRAFKPNYIPSAAFSFHFIRDQASNIPVVSIVADFYDLFGFFGILNTWDSGEEIPASFTYLYSNLESYSAACGLEIHAPSPVEQQAFRLTAKSTYNDPVFSFPFFGTDGAEVHNALILRNGGDDALEENGSFIRDRIIHQAFDEIRPEHATSDALSVNVYLNGNYWGIYQLRERQDSAFISHHFSESHFDLLERSAEYPTTKHALAGNWDDFDLLEETVTSLDLSQDENLAFIEEWVDLSNFIDYQLTEIFIANQDWLSNNVKLWRPLDESRPWQWLLWDTDWGLGMWGNSYPVGSPDWNALEFALSDWGGWLEDEVETELLQSLILNESFKARFASRAADLRNSTFETYRWNERIDSTLNELANEIPYHFERWELNLADWEAEVDTLKLFVAERPAFFMEHFQAQFDLGAIHALSLNSSPPEIGSYEVNSLTLDSAAWSGDYFQALSVRIKAVPPVGYALIGWSDLSSNQLERFIELSSDSAIVALYEPIENQNSIWVNEIMYAPTNSAADWIELYNPGPDTSNLIGYSIQTESFDITINDSLLLMPESFLVIASDSLSFLTNHPFFDGALLQDEALTLGQTTTTIKVITPFEVIEDSVRYALTSPWPFQANGSGASLEFSIGLLENSLGTNWFADVTEMGSPGAQNTAIAMHVNGQQLEGIRIAPNPCASYFMVQNTKELCGADYKLLSAQGETVKSGQFSNGIRQVIDCSDLASGTYLFLTEGTNERFNKVLVKL